MKDIQGSIVSKNAISPGHLMVAGNASLFPNDVHDGFMLQPGAAAYQLNAINYVTGLVKGGMNTHPWSPFGPLTGIQDNGSNL